MVAGPAQPARCHPVIAGLNERILATVTALPTVGWRPRGRCRALDDTRGRRAASVLHQVLARGHPGGTAHPRRGGGHGANDLRSAVIVIIALPLVHRSSWCSSAWSPRPLRRSDAGNEHAAVPGTGLDRGHPHAARPRRAEQQPTASPNSGRRIDVRLWRCASRSCPLVWNFCDARRCLVAVSVGLRLVFGELALTALTACCWRGCSGRCARSAWNSTPRWTEGPPPRRLRPARRTRRHRSRTTP